MPAIRVLAFEDDDLHADILRMHLHEMGYELLGIHAHTNDLVPLISASRPDIVLMDIELQDRMAGIQAAQKINAIFNVPLIYLTSLPTGIILNDVKATFPEAYLTKPYTAEQLRSAIEIAVYKYQKALLSATAGNNYHPSKYLYVKVNNNLVRLSYEDIRYIEAYDKYCFIYTPDKRHLVSVPLKQLLPKLPPQNFIQVHRSYVVNLQVVTGVRTQQNKIEIQDNLIPYSKSFKDELFNRLNII
ncbi:MAG TPA: response regulator transcription factor [Mucilaginibacter sp.]|jgi:DNA-binding LytR/AlgR family response regulator|nr:response regulator transcription factor [Mucilaginibacter sp.]